MCVLCGLSVSSSSFSFFFCCLVDCTFWICARLSLDVFYCGMQLLASCSVDWLYFEHTPYIAFTASTNRLRIGAENMYEYFMVFRREHNPIGLIFLFPPPPECPCEPLNGQKANRAIFVLGKIFKYFTVCVSASVCNNMSHAIYRYFYGIALLIINL